MTSTAGRWLTVVLAALALASCATTTTLDAGREGVHSVAVVSLAGGYMTRMNVGITVLGNESEEEDVSRLQLDPRFAGVLAEVLERKAALKAVVAPAPQPLKELFRPSSLAHVALPLQSQWGHAEGTFRAIAAGKGVDAVVVLAPATSGDYYWGSNQLLRGLGLYTRSFGDHTTTSVLHLICAVVVVSGKTGKVMAYTTVSRVQPDIPGGPHQRGQPSVTAPAPLSRAPLKSLAEPQMTALRDLALSLPLQEALEATVPVLVKR